MSRKHGSLSAQALKRLQGGKLILKGYDNDEIAEIVEVSLHTVRKWRKRLKENNDDLSSLSRKHGSGKPPLLTDEQKQQLKQMILEGAIAHGYPNERWTSKTVADLIQKHFGITMASRTVRDLLPTLGLSPQMPIVRSHKKDDEEAMRWAAQQWKRIKKSQKTRYSIDIFG